MDAPKSKVTSATKIAACTTQFVCFLLLGLAFTSCEERRHFVHWNGSDHFCDGKTFSLLVEKEDGVQAVQFMEHGSGYRASSKSDSWLVQWKLDALKESQTNYPANVIYLGHREVIQKRDKPLPVNESGVDLAGFRASAEANYVLREAERLEVFNVTGQTRGQLVGAVETGTRERVVFNRSRQHFFTWKPFPAIYACNNLSVVRKIPLTERFKEFHAEFHSVENHLVVLTDDLRYLIAVPHNGGESPQGFNHYKAHCYDFTSDDLTTKAIRFGTNYTAISAVENVNGSLLFIAFSDSEKLALLDGESKVLVDLVSSGTRFFNFGSNFHWDYRNRRVFISGSKIDLDMARREVVLEEYAYEEGQKKRFVLNAGQMQIPTTKP
jgi:hypothetical protein